jgi:hypothetical protein
VESRERIELPAGWAEWDRGSFVQVGDRAVPQRIEVTFPSSPDGWPSLHMTIEVRRGAPHCTELTIRAHPDGREVRGVDYRAVDLENWVDTIAAEASMDVVTADDGTTVFRRSLNRALRSSGAGEAIDASLPEFARMLRDDSGEKESRQARKTIKSARSGARRIVTDDVLRKVAEVYRENVADRPVEAVGGAFRTTHRTAARYVQRAREQGFLPPTTQGKVSG